MADAIRFHFDPICPWCYQTSRWVHRLVDLGEVRATWGLFSLEIQNEGRESAEAARRHAWSRLGLRTAVVVRDRHGQDALGAFYADLGRRYHEEGEALQEPATVEAALTVAGLSPGLAADAAADDATWDTVRAEHDALVTETRSFGVPAIVLDDGAGPAIFGPVISNPPDDEEAVELWHHVRWLARNENFSELKRDRLVDPDLARFRKARAANAG